LEDKGDSNKVGSLGMGRLLKFMACLKPTFNDSCVYTNEKG